MPKRIARVLRAVITADEAKSEPYPYIYVNADGTARELHPNERKYLETPFDMFDGARPYVKDSYPKKNGWGEISGFISRSNLPEGMQLQAAPTEDPQKKFALSDLLQRARDRGWEVSETSKNTITLKKPKR